MSWKHIVAIGLGIMLVLAGGILVLLCGRNPVCSAPGSFSAVITLATTIAGTGGMVITGAYGHANSNRDSNRPAPPAPKE